MLPSLYASLCIKCHKKHYVKIANCITCHRGINKSSRKKIAHFGLITSKYSDFLINKNSINYGKDLVEKAHCRRCHFINLKGNSIAKNLNITGKNHIGEYIFFSIKNPNEFMPDFKFDNNSIFNITKYILFISSNKKFSKILPYPVLINNSKQNSFERHCANCHKIISKNYGPIGNFDIGPNLSGIFTNFFSPKKEYKIKKWDNKLIKKWLKNPRSIYKQALMPPIILEKEEVKNLLDVLN